MRAEHHQFRVSGCVLRAASLDDTPFFRQLYRSFRAEELAQMPWPQEAKQAFLDQQFDLQHRYYIAAFPQTDFLVIEKDGIAIGRLYIQSGRENWHIIDIGFLPEWRGRGLGSATLKAIQDAATAKEAGGIGLHVDRNNGRAFGLYQALGFTVVDVGDTHIRMQWLSPRSTPETADGRSGVN